MKLTEYTTPRWSDSLGYRIGSNETLISNWESHVGVQDLSDSLEIGKPWKPQSLVQMLAACWKRIADLSRQGSQPLGDLSFA